MSGMKKLFAKILKFAPIAWLLWFCGFLWRIIGRFAIPVLLLIMISLPLVLTFAKSQKKEDGFPTAEKIQFGTLIKSVKNTANIEFDYSYSVKNWQTAKLDQILVKEGDLVKNGQELAKISFVNGTELRDTDTQNQLRTAKQDLANLKKSKSDISGINEATGNQSNVQLGNRQIEEKLAIEKYTDKIRDNGDKKERLIRERDNLQKTYDQIRLGGNSYDSLVQYQTELKTKQDQLNTLGVGASTITIQNQINQQRSTIAGLRTQLDSGICDFDPIINPSISPISSSISISNISSTSISSANSVNSASSVSSALSSIPIIAPPITIIGKTKTPYNNTACNSAYAQINAAYEIINNLQKQLDGQSNVDNNLSNRLQSEINELQNKINIIKNSQSYKKLQSQSLPINDAQITANTQKILADIQADITIRKNDIKIIEDGDTKLLEDQIKTAARLRNQTEYDKDVQNQTLNKNISDLDQKIATTLTTIKNLETKLVDSQKDIQDQTDSKTLKAKKEGVVGKINFQEKVEIPVSSNVFDIISDKKLLRLDVSAETRSSLQEKLAVKILNPELNSWENLAISKIDASPLAKLNQNDDTKYRIEVDIDREKQNKLTVGKTLDLEIILQKLDNVYFTNRTAVVDNKIFVGNGEKEIGNAKEIKDKKFKYKELLEKSIKTGLDTGRFIQITEGVAENTKVFPIFPKSENDKKKFQEQFLDK